MREFRKRPRNATRKGLTSVVITGALVAGRKIAVSRVSDTTFAASFVEALRDELSVRTSKLYVVFMRHSASATVAKHEVTE